MQNNNTQTASPQGLTSHMEEDPLQIIYRNIHQDGEELIITNTLQLTSTEREEERDSIALDRYRAVEFNTFWDCISNVNISTSVILGT